MPVCAQPAGQRRKKKLRISRPAAQPRRGSAVRGSRCRAQRAGLAARGGDVYPRSFVSWWRRASAIQLLHRPQIPLLQRPAPTVDARRPGMACWPSGAAALRAASVWGQAAVAGRLESRRRRADRAGPAPAGNPGRLCHAPLSDHRDLPAQASPPSPLRCARRFSAAPRRPAAARRQDGQGPAQGRPHGAAAAGGGALVHACASGVTLA